VERADKILAGRRVDTGLAADRGIDHAEQRRRHLDHPYAPEPARGDEAGEVGHGAAANPDNRVVTGESCGPEPVPASGRDVDRLAGLGIRNLYR